VSVDSIDKHLDFGKKYGLDFPLLSDQVKEHGNCYYVKRRFVSDRKTVF
jgi:peroxiredoxin